MIRLATWKSDEHLIATSLDDGVRPAAIINRVRDDERAVTSKREKPERPAVAGVAPHALLKEDNFSEGTRAASEAPKDGGHRRLTVLVLIAFAVGSHERRLIERDHVAAAEHLLVKLHDLNLADARHQPFTQRLLRRAKRLRRAGKRAQEKKEQADQVGSESHLQYPVHS
jgi:hypothetical protein